MNYQTDSSGKQNIRIKFPLSILNEVPASDVPVVLRASGAFAVILIRMMIIALCSEGSHG